MTLMGALRTYPRSRTARASLEATLTSATAAPCPRLGWPETAVSARGKALRSPSMLEARAEPKKGRTDPGQAGRRQSRYRLARAGLRSRSIPLGKGPFNRGVATRGSAAPRGASKLDFRGGATCAFGERGPEGCAKVRFFEGGGRLSHLKRLSAAVPPDKSLLGGGPVFRRDRPRADAVEVEKPSERVVVGDVFLEMSSGQPSAAAMAASNSRAYGLRRASEGSSTRLASSREGSAPAHHARGHGPLG
jgi:hypothetical protein